jgi:hypothetical protein
MPPTAILYESGFAPRRYVTRVDIDESALTPVQNQTFRRTWSRCSLIEPSFVSRLVRP